MTVRYLLATSIAVAVVAVIEAARQLARWADETRAEARRERPGALGRDRGAGTLLRDQRLARWPFLDRLLRRSRLAAPLLKLLRQSDAGLTVAELLAASALAGCATLLVGLVARLGPAALPMAGVAAFLPTVALLVSRRRRSDRVSEQLPDALDMLSRALRAGHTLATAFETAANELPAPLAVELGRVFEAQRLGRPLDEALLGVVERIPGNADVRMLAVAVTIQRETGGNLAELLGRLAETIRARQRFFWKLRGLTAEGRASAVVLGALPFAVAAGVTLLSPGYLAPLVADRAGQLVLGYAVLSWLVGVAWLKRMAMVDY